MRVKINVEDLKKAAADMDFIMKGNMLNMLDSLLITATANAITLTVNNLKIRAEKRVPGEVLQEGNALLHRDDLGILLKMKNDVELDFTGKQCTMTGNRIFTCTVEEGADEFPVMPEIPEGEPVFAIPEKDLLYCLKLRKLIATDGQDRLRGIWIDKNNILACDGYRLGKIEMVYHSANRFMLPDFVLTYLTKALDKKSLSLVVFHLSEKGYVKAFSDNFEITFRQYDGELISYENMFVTNDVQTAAFQKQDLVEAIGFICDISKNNRKAKSPVTYNFCDNRLTLDYKAANKHVEEEIKFTNQNADKIGLTVGFNPLYNYELLSMVESDRITMSFANSYSPSIIHGENESEKYLLLPVRLKNAA